MTKPGYLTRQAAADYVGLSSKTLANMASKGDGPRFYRSSGKPVYKPAELDEWVESHGLKSRYRRTTPKRVMGKPTGSNLAWTASGDDLSAALAAIQRKH